MRHTIFAAAAALLAAHVCTAQSLPPATTDSDAAKHTMVRAAGMPLNDGSLPPGMLTVRVVRGAFTADLQDVTVHADVAGGKTETARTGADGRAQFAHLPVGAQVRISASVAGGQLTSDVFSVPADSGVRVLLVVDDGTDGGGVASAAGSSFTPRSTPDAPIVTAGNAAAARGGPSAGVLAIRVFFTIATLAAFALVLFRQTGPPRGARG